MRYNGTNQKLDVADGVSGLRYGVLMISHGSRSSDWVRLVDEAIEQVRRRLPADVPVFSSFLELVEGRLIADGVRALEAERVDEIVVVPLFVSSGSTHLDEIAFALGVKAEPELPTDLERIERQVGLRMLAPIDDDPDIATIVVERIRPLSLDPAQETVLLVGHGSNQKGFYLRWRRGLERLAVRVRELGGYADCEIAMLLPDQLACKMKVCQARKPGQRVVVAPLFLSEGYFTNKVIPNRLVGYTYAYNGRALLPHPLLVRWIERQLEQAGVIERLQRG